MAAESVLDFRGLVTAPGALGDPKGSMSIATNVNFPAPGLVEKRQGFARYTNRFGGASWKFFSSKQLGTKILANTGSSTAAANLMYGDGVSGPYASVTTPDGTNVTNTPTDRMRVAVMLKNHFITSTRAPGRLGSNFSFSWAGMPRVPGCYGVPTVIPAAGSWLTAAYAVAYRVVWVTTDDDGVERVSAPSGRYVVANIATTAGYTGGVANTALTVYLPRQTETTATNLTTAWKLRVYRTFQFNTATGQPNDEMQQCYEYALTAPDIAIGYVYFVDTCPESALGAYLYTNTVSGGDVSTGVVRAGSTSLGILAANDRPPLAKDVAVFADCAWWANFVTPQRLQVSILAVGAAGNVLKAGDVLTIAGYNYTAVAGAPGATNQFQVQVGLGSVAENIRATAISLVGAINAYSSNDAVWATYIGSDASPGTIGSILIERRRTDAASFQMSTSGSAVPFLPQLTAVSSQDSWGNGLAISKPFQADAVPPANYVRVGRNDTVIQALVPLRDALYIFTDDGIWWARGNTPADFVLEPFDTTFRLMGRENAVALGDAIYAWGREGIARITNGGVEYLDLPIRNTVEAIVAENNVTNMAIQGFAVAYRTKRRVVFFYRTTNEDQNYGCQSALVYNEATGVWSTYDLKKENAKSCGVVVSDDDDNLRLGEWSNGADTYIYYEQDSQVDADYSDTSAAGAAFAVVTTLRWSAATPDPAMVCHWQELQLFWSYFADLFQHRPTSVEVQITADYGTSSTVTLVPTSDTQSRLMIPHTIGLASRQVVLVTHSVSENFGMSGYKLLYKPVSNFTNR